MWHSSHACISFDFSYKFPHLIDLQFVEEIGGQTKNKAGGGAFICHMDHDQEVDAQHSPAGYACLLSFVFARPSTTMCGIVLCWVMAE